MAALTPITAPSQLCVSCFVYRPPAHQEACNSCLSAKSHPSTPVPSQTLGAWLEEWKASVYWWPDEFSYEIGCAEVSSPFAKKCETMVTITDQLLQAVYRDSPSVEDLLDDLDDQMNLTDYATPSEEFLSACIAAHSALKLSVAIAETKADLPATEYTDFVLHHLATAEKLMDARNRHLEHMIDEMVANCQV